MAIESKEPGLRTGPLQQKRVNGLTRLQRLLHSTEQGLRPRIAPAGGPSGIDRLADSWDREGGGRGGTASNSAVTRLPRSGVDADGGRRNNKGLHATLPPATGSSGLSSHDSTV